MSAVGLVADDHDRLAATRRRVPDVVRRRSRCEAVVDLGLAERERGRRLSRAQQRAREHRIGDESLVAQPLSERACMLAPLCGQRAQLVGVAGCRFGVADDEEAHRRNDSLALVAGLRYVVCDVFTDVPLAGNQLAVFTDAREIPEPLLQQLAKEMSFSETVFVYPPEAGGHVRMRIFTPAFELPFAGHPILGTAFVLAGPLQLVEIRLETGAGIVPVRLEREGARIVFGWMTQPVPTFEPYADRDALLAALGADATDLPVELYRLGPGHVMVELHTPEDVAALRPNLSALAELSSVGTDCFARDGGRWRSRVFVPGSGVDEDPATGSAAGPLALHLARHGRIAFGDEIEISQGTEIGRPSTLYAVARSETDVEVGGSAVVVARGEFRL
jgi:trans-2,3-dihydro-3-hydroxyanthranilate isomerase